MTDLPRTWELTRLSDVVEVLDSRRVPVNAAARALRPGSVPYFGATGQVGFIDRPLFNEELVLLGEDGAPFLDPSKPKAYLIEGPSWVNNHAHVLRATSATSNRFLKYFFDSTDYRPHVNGTTRLKLTQAAMRCIPILLPPLAEQERIVVAIEEHLSRLAGAAGQLRVAELRLNSLRAKIKESILPDAPFVSLGDLKVESRYGTSVRCSYEASGPGILRIPNIAEEQIDPTDLKYSTASSELLPTMLVQDGDVLFVRTNGSRDLIGRAAVASGASVGLGFASYLIQYHFPANVDTMYVCAAVSAPSSRRALEHMAATTAGQYNLSISKLDSVSIPLPALETQRRLVAERATALDAIARLAAALDAARLRGSRLRRSILAAAFSGQLVPQDPTDEPASVLLQRIRAERDALPGRGRTRKVTS